LCEGVLYMKIVRFSLFIVLIFILELFAQSNDIQVKIRSIPGSEVDWEFELSVVLPVSPSQGFILEIPEEIVPIPVAVRANEKDLWLQNISSIPERDSVIAWQTVNNGIMFLFRDKLLQAGDRLVIKFMATVLKTPEGNKKITMKEIVSRNDGLEVSNREFVSGSIPSISNR